MHIASCDALGKTEPLDDRKTRAHLNSLMKSLRERKMAKSKHALDGRHRDKSGRIDKKHGNTRVGTLRKEYGDSFAEGRRKDMMLKSLLRETGTASLHEYLRQHHK
jgi:hypothetical protein